MVGGDTHARAPQAVENIRSLRALEAESPGAADAGPDATLTLAATGPGPNPALDDFAPEQCIAGGSWVVRNASFFVKQVW